MNEYSAALGIISLWMEWLIGLFLNTTLLRWFQIVHIPNANIVLQGI